MMVPALYIEKVKSKAIEKGTITVACLGRDNDRERFYRSAVLAQVSRRRIKFQMYPDEVLDWML